MRRPSMHPLTHPFEHAAVGVLKDLLVLHPQSDERVDVEETPVAQVAVRAAPPGQAIVLQIQQRVQRVGICVHVGDGLVDRGRDERIVLEQATEVLAKDGLVAMPPAHAGAIGRRWPRKLAERIGQKGECIRAGLPRGTTEHADRESSG